jgi:hypothetical protein
MSTAPLPYFHDGWPRHVYVRETVHDYSTRASGVGLSLWTGSANGSPPSGWETPSYDDSAWGVLWPCNSAFDPPTTPESVWSHYPGPLSGTEQALFRFHFAVPAGVVIAAGLSYSINDASQGFWLNGHLISGTVQSLGLGNSIPPPAGTWTGNPVTVPPAFVAPGATNLLAVWAANMGAGGLGDAGVYFDLAITLDT